MSFTMFDKFKEAFAMLSDDDRRAAEVALCEYGFYGAEPGEGSMSFAALLVFKAFKEDVSNSAASHGRRGGRPPKARALDGKGAGGPPAANGGAPDAAASGEAAEETPAETAAETPIENPVENPVAKPGFEKGEKLRVAPQTKPNQTNTDQTRPERGRGRARESVARHPPAPGDVSAYMRARGTPIDAERFCDFYASKGWRVGREPMRDWKAAARNWAARDARGAEGATADASEFAQYD